MKIDKFCDNALAHRGPGPLQMFYKEIRAALEATGKLPEELEDTITAKIIEVDGETRAIIGWA
jgi:hypothetical protein